MKITRSVLFTTCMGRVLNSDKEAVAEFLGSEAHEAKLSELGHTTNGNEILAFIREISPPNTLINLYKGGSPLGGGCEEWVLAEVSPE